MIQAYMKWKVESQLVITCIGIGTVLCMPSDAMMTTLLEEDLGLDNKGKIGPSM